MRLSFQLLQNIFAIPVCMDIVTHIESSPLVAVGLVYAACVGMGIFYCVNCVVTGVVPVLCGVIFALVVARDLIPEQVGSPTELEPGLSYDRYETRQKLTHPWLEALDAADTFDKSLALLKIRPGGVNCWPGKALSQVADMRDLEEQKAALEKLRGVIAQLSPVLLDAHVLDMLPEALRRPWIICNGMPSCLEFYFDAPDAFIQNLNQRQFRISTWGKDALVDQPRCLAQANMASCRLRLPLFPLENLAKFFGGAHEEWHCVFVEQVCARRELQYLHLVVARCQTSPELRAFVHGYLAENQADNAWMSEQGVAIG